MHVREAPRAAVVARGIPKMFRWLTDQYPAIMERMADGLPAQQKKSDVDDLYLDMNGIIHMCTHGNDPEIAETSARDQLVRIFAFTDKVCKIVAPKRTIVLAVDGVAPRAKMNQQRSRRFRSAKEREELRAELVAAGRDVPADADAFDSNCITPGTAFMAQLGEAFEAWLAHKGANDPFYESVEIVFSGPDVAGEGEHKVMDFIRARQKTETRGSAKHCFYGLDADLIMLGLVTHEPKFLLLREKMSVRHARRGRKPKDPLEYTRYDFELLEVGLLRDMLRLQFDEDRDVERLVDALGRREDPIDGLVEASLRPVDMQARPERRVLAKPHGRDLRRERRMRRRHQSRRRRLRSRRTPPPTASSVAAACGGATAAACRRLVRGWREDQLE